MLLIFILYSSSAYQLLEMKNKGGIYWDTTKFLWVMCISMLSCFLHLCIFSVQKYCELLNVFWKHMLLLLIFCLDSHVLKQLFLLLIYCIPFICISKSCGRIIYFYSKLWSETKKILVLTYNTEWSNGTNSSIQ